VAAAASSDAPSISDHFVGLFTGESAMERVARQRFLKFKKFILEELKVAEAVCYCFAFHICLVDVEK